MRKNLVLLLSIAAFAPACGSADGLDESDDAEIAGKADSVSTTSTFYQLRPDLRRCVSPLCGGDFAHRVNFSTTTCADGNKSAECYVAEVDYKKTGLSDDEIASLPGGTVLRGKIVAKTYGTFGNLGTLQVTEVWAPAGKTEPTGIFYRVTDAGLRCFAAPCPSTHEAKLNSTSSKNVAGFDLSGAGATDEQVNDANNDVFSGGALLVAGTNETVHGPAGNGLQLKATQFYSRVKHVEAPPAEGQFCGGIAGFQCPDGQICDVTTPNACNGADLGGTCKVKPQFCFEIYKPVCGCDGKTYGNDCERQGAGVQLDHDGACETAN